MSFLKCRKNLQFTKTSILYYMKIGKVLGGGSISNYEDKSPILVAWDDTVAIICMLVQLEVGFFLHFLLIVRFV